MDETLLVHYVADQYSNCLPDGMLAAAGYRVEQWPDGEAFLSDADKSLPACVLLDLGLPGLSASEVQARMPAAGLDFPVIMLTQLGDLATAVQAMKAGAADVVETPCDRETLLRSVEGVFLRIAGRQARRERAQSAQAQLAGLTDREREVLDQLACGYPNSSVAGRLGVRLQDVVSCREDVVGKLGLGNFADALRIAFAAGWGSGNGSYSH